MKLFSMLEIILILLLVSCSRIGAEQLKQSDLNASGEMKMKRAVNFTIDPRIEALAIIQYLSDSQMVSKNSAEYVQAVEKWFGHLRGHKAVQMIPVLEKRGFSHDLPIIVLLQYDGIPFTNMVNTLPDDEKHMTNKRISHVFKKIRFDTLIECMNDFIIESNLEEFLENQAEYYSIMLNELTEVFQYSRLVEEMIEWYGYPQDSYNYIVSPFLYGNGYGPSIHNQGGGLDLYCISGFFPDRETLESLMLHEFSHSYVNPLVNMHYKKIDRVRKLHKEIKKEMQELAYNSWWVTVAEHYVRAATIRIYKQMYPESTIESLLRGEISSGFIYMEHINDELEKYEQTKVVSQIDFRDYFPTLVNSLLQLSTDFKRNTVEPLQFRGTIGSVYSNKTYIIVPSSDSEGLVNSNILPNAEFVANCTGGKIITDQEAVKMKLNNNPLIVYGTYETNLWLDKHKKSLYFEIYADRIVADSTYYGTDLRIISCQPNPLNPKLGMIVYAAQNLDSMKGSNAVMHGDQEFVISNRKLEIIKSGFYPKPK